VLLGDLLTADTKMGMGSPAAGGVANPLRTGGECKRVSTPVLGEAVAQGATAHFDRPLPDVGKADPGDSASAQAGEIAHPH
jgi:hypothetical protein